MKATAQELLDTLATRGIVSFVGDLTDAFELRFSDWICKTRVTREGGGCAHAFYREGELHVEPAAPGHPADEKLAADLLTVIRSV